MKKIINRICAVKTDSIAQELGIQPGDCLISIDNTPVADFFDYSLRTNATALIVEIEKKDGERIEFDIEKDEYENLGMEFEQPLMDNGKSCANKCVFCFIDQLPPNLRESLYFKDDDLRLSFLTGNYVTLTNLTDGELDRIISYRLSPVNISVHATDPALRVKIMKNKRAGMILDQLKKITAAGIKVNCQIVICPGINDGESLQQTLRDLFALGSNILSIALVPVGLTRFREKDSGASLRAFSRSDAIKTIGIVEKWQKEMVEKCGERIIFAADEIYIKAGLPFPQAEEYEIFPQLENGVGVVPLFIKEMREGIEKRIKRAKRPAADPQIKRGTEQNPAGKKILLITGVDAKPYLESFVSSLSSIYGGEFNVMAIPNRFFGKTVTVAGLITGRDIIYELNRIKAAGTYEEAVIPSCMLRANEDIFLDEMSVSQVEKETGLSFLCAEPSGEGFLRAMDKFCVMI